MPRTYNPVVRARMAYRAGNYYNDGKTLMWIAEELRCSYGLVHRFVTEQGIPLRKRGGTRNKQ